MDEYVYSSFEIVDEISLQVLLEALEPVPGLDAEAFMDVMHGSEMIDQDIRDAKIVHQAKKIKKLTVSMNKERGRTAAIQDKLERAQKEMENMETKKGDTEGSPTNGAQSAAKANRKVEEYRMKLENANEQLKQYHRALVKEVYLVIYGSFNMCIIRLEMGLRLVRS